VAQSLFVGVQQETASRVCRDLVHLRTEERLQFIDVTELVAERVRRSAVANGLALVQSRHTTAAMVVNEAEPRLLEDFRALLERWAPRGFTYRHNDLAARTDVPPDERPNGDSHARALLLGVSVCLNVADGRLDLGTWQRVFLVELDGPRQRSFSIHVVGVGAEGVR
jgi:secondary thiamine-phosphate synthase enzyme